MSAENVDLVRRAIAHWQARDFDRMAELAGAGDIGAGTVIGRVFLTQAVVAFLAALESLLSARVADGMSDVRRSDPDRELYESGALLPGPEATLSGPTFEEWLDSTSTDEGGNR